MAGKVRIVVVEDHALVREGMVAMLETDEDFDVVGAASDGASGLEECRRELPDVVLLDLGLPDMPGLEVLRTLKDERPETRVVVVTVHDEQAYVGDALRAGADGYVLKTINHMELGDAVRRVVKGEAVLHPGVAKKVMEEFAALSRGERPAGELSGREQQVLELLAEGLSNRQIADRLGLGVETVKTHVSNVIEKLGASDRTHAVALAMRRGLVD